MITKIPGTDPEVFGLALMTEVYKVNDVLQIGLNGRALVVNKLKSKDDIFRYNLESELDGEKLEAAIQHFKFLCRYGLC